VFLTHRLQTKYSDVIVESIHGKQHYFVKGFVLWATRLSTNNYRLVWRASSVR